MVSTLAFSLPNDLESQLTLLSLSLPRLSL